jgi:hypothetical protein
MPSFSTCESVTKCFRDILMVAKDLEFDCRLGIPTGPWSSCILNSKHSCIPLDQAGREDISFHPCTRFFIQESTPHDHSGIQLPAIIHSPMSKSRRLLDIVFLAVRLGPAKMGTNAEKQPLSLFSANYSRSCRDFVKTRVSISRA